MIIKIPTIVKILFGTDHFEFKAYQVRVKWDENSFTIQGVFKPNVIKVDGDSENGS